MLRFQFQTKKVCRERLPKFAFGNLGKRSMERWERSAHWERWQRSGRVRRF